MAQRNLSLDLDQLLDACAGLGSTLDELTILRASLRFYAEGMTPQDAVAEACALYSNALTKTSPT